MDSYGISQFVDAVANRATPMLIAIAGIGTLSMAVIQTLKDLTPARRRFNQRFLHRWIAQRAAESQTDGARAESDLIQLATAGDALAFYDLPIEQLCGQANAAAQVVLEYPARHSELLLVLGARGDHDDVRTLLEGSKARDVAAQKDAALPARSQAEIDARARLTHLVQRSLDGLQISAASQWKFWLQGIAFLLSYTFTVIGVAFYTGRAVMTLKGWLIMVFVGLAAGFLAPIARDLVAALQQRVRG